MLIQKKFDYRPLARIDSPDGRKYCTPDGNNLVSVKTILSKTKDMTHLKEWIDRIGEVNAERIKTEACNIGNGMHKNIEKYILGEDMSGALLSKILAKVIIKEGFPHITEIWGSEVALYTEGLYAGTTDLVGRWLGEPAIMDFKNSLKDKKREWIDDYFMQLCGYKLSHDEMYGTDIKRGVIMIATRDAKYQEFIIEGSEMEYYTYKWLKKVEEYYDRFGKAQ